MKKMLIAGNWKMNKIAAEATELAASIVNGVNKLSGAMPQILVCPPFLSIASVVKAAVGSPVIVGAQNCHNLQKGAYTGEVSAQMVADSGCKYVIVGHSERRAYFGESDEFINLKAHAAITENLIPIICIGETLEQRQNGETFDIVANQLKGCLAGFDKSYSEKIVIAYEPVWAIGTGISATAAQVDEAHNFIRQELNKYFETEAENVIILYGGSLTAENADEVLSIRNVNGGLIGGASLKAEVFLKIISISQKYL